MRAPGRYAPGAAAADQIGMASRTTRPRVPASKELAPGAHRRRVGNDLGQVARPGFVAGGTRQAILEDGAGGNAVARVRAGAVGRRHDGADMNAVARVRAGAMGRRHDGADMNAVARVRAGVPPLGTLSPAAQAHGLPTPRAPLRYTGAAWIRPGASRWSSGCATSSPPI
jgi:hypothetical protein